MKKWFSLLLCLTLLFSVAPFSFAEELAMLTADETVAEYGPIAVVAPEDEPSAGDISVEELEISADSLSGYQEEILTADAAARSELIALCLSTAADFSGEALPAEGLEAFDSLDASYIVTADSSYQISIPDNFIKSAQSTTDNFVYQHTQSDMVVSVTLANQTTPEYNYTYLSYNGYAPKKAEFNNVPVVFGSKNSGGKYHWIELFNTAGKTVMLQSIHSASYYVTGATITTEFFTSVKNVGPAELVVVPPTYTLSADQKSIFINRPAISGGTGNYTVAYNIYDSNGNPVNYFYSNEAVVAASPGYNGIFCVFVVVSDGQTSQTVNTGWMNITGYVTMPLTVTAGTWSISADQRSIFINRPTISGGTGNYTIAYNIYDSNSNPVNYFYSNEPAVAATPGYNGLFNVYIVVSDGISSQTLMTGWFTLSGYPNQPRYRALCIGQTYANSPSISTLSCCSTDARTVAAMLCTMTSTPYNINTQIDLTASQILSAIASTFAGATADDVSLFYYSGHGVKFTNTAEYNGALLGTDDEYILFAELRLALDRIPGKKIVILDSCYSGNSIDKAVGDDITELRAFANMAVSAFKESGTKSGELLSGSYYVLVACRKDQTSRTGSPVSVFTRHFAQCCGYSPVTNSSISFTCDSNGDYQISLQEAYTGTYNGVYEAGYSSLQTTVVYPSNSNQIIFGR